ncbi:phosphate ABC transporter substrate-binding protein [Bacillus horti]|nr:phosphate ABC transporter substrate-binding protein [Bacillus horti]
MKKNVKSMGLLVLLGLLLVFAAACGNSDSNTGNENPPATQDEETPEQENNEDANTEEDEEATVSGSITAVGSSAIQPLVEAAAHEFMGTNPDARIQVEGGGSGTGLSQVDQGGADIGNSDIFAEEKEDIDAASLVDHRVAIVGMGATAHPEVGVDNVTQQELIDIFTGKITNWSEIGGADVDITLVNRPESSGTRATFYKFALNENQEAEGITQDSSGTVRQIISETPGAIGYLAFSYYNDSVLPLKLDGVEQTDENVANGTYPVWAYMHMYTKGEPDGLAKAFLDYMSSDAVVSIIQEQGYIAESTMQIERDAEGNVSDK